MKEPRFLKAEAGQDEFEKCLPNFVCLLFRSLTRALPGLDYIVGSE